MKAFEYYEVRPVLEMGMGKRGTCTAYDTVEEWEAAIAVAAGTGDFYQTFWSIYGRYTEDGQTLTQCVGDFDTKEAALDVLTAILGAAIKARAELDAASIENANWHWMKDRIQKAAATLDDMINQSSNEERL